MHSLLVIIKSAKTKTIQRKCIMDKSIIFYYLILAVIWLASQILSLIFIILFTPIKEIGTQMFRDYLYKHFPKHNPSYKKTRKERYQTLLNYFVAYKYEVDQYYYEFVRTVYKHNGNFNFPVIKLSSKATDLLLNIGDFCNVYQVLFSTELWDDFLKLTNQSSTLLTNPASTPDEKDLDRLWFDVLHQIDKINCELNKIIIAI